MLAAPELRSHFIFEFVAQAAHNSKSICAVPATLCDLVAGLHETSIRLRVPLMCAG
jgi:hypothetical protein